MSDVLAELKGVSKTFPSGGDEIAAVDQVNLVIETGEFVVVVGPSGSGKTTLLALIGLLLTPSLGQVDVMGSSAFRDADARARIRREHIGMVFQDSKLIPYETTMENVETALLFRTLRPNDRQDMADASLSAVGLSGRLDHLPRQLSAGEQQRVALARALVTDPVLLLADEPTGNLDTRTGEEMLKILSHTVNDGRSVVMVTHDPEAMAHATRRLEMRDGGLRVVT